MISAADLLPVLGGSNDASNIEQAELIIKSLSQSDRPFVTMQVCQAANSKSQNLDLKSLVQMIRFLHFLLIFSGIR